MNATAGLHVEARGVSRTFHDGVERVAAVSDVSLVLEPGEFVGLRGRSGAGKTTLLALLGGIERPSAGAVLLDGDDLAAASRTDRTRLARATGLAFQGAAAIRRMPVWENVACVLVPLGIPPNERRASAVAALEPVGLAHLADRRPEQLSAGERQRMALARALVAKPRLLLADEPTSNLDPESAEQVVDALVAAHAAGCTVVVSAHDDALLGRAGRVLTLEGGRLDVPA